MPGAVPTWIVVTPKAVYAGRIGDGALPDSTLVSIDRGSFEARVAVIPAETQSGMEWPPEWHVATVDEAAGYSSLVEFSPEMDGIPAVSWIGHVVIDTEGIEVFLESLKS